MLDPVCPDHIQKDKDNGDPEINHNHLRDDSSPSSFDGLKINHRTTAKKNVSTLTQPTSFLMSLLLIGNHHRFHEYVYLLLDLFLDHNLR
jgi:hypothetical protein